LCGRCQWSPASDPKEKLVGIFSRPGEESQAKIVANGHRAAVTAIMMIANRGELRNGDKLAVSYYDETDG